MDPASILSAPPRDQLTLSALAKERGVSHVTPWRWALRGIGGVRLPTIKVGKKRLTSRPIFLEWCRQVTAIANGDRVPVDKTQSIEDEAIEQEADRLLGLAGDKKKEG